MIMKNRTIKKLIAIMTLLVVMATAWTPAFAYEAIDMGHDATLAIEFTGTKVSGMEFRAYKVADVDSSANFTFTEAMSGYGLMMPNDQAGYRALAETLAAYVARDGVTPAATATTDEAGKAEFGILEKGLYLVLADTYTLPENEMTYVVSPSLVALPNSVDGSTWIYDVTISPKYTEVPPVPETPGTVDINVIKIWSGESDASKRPTDVEAELICEGKVVDTVTLNAENNWRHTWKELEDGKSYSVTEKVVPAGYTVTITRDGNTFTMNNYQGNVPPTTPPIPELPRTGQLWWPVPLLIGLGLMLVVAGTIRKRKA